MNASFHPIVPPWISRQRKFKIGDRVRVVFRGIKGPAGVIEALPPPPSDSRGFLGMYRVRFDGVMTKHLAPEMLELIPPDGGGADSS
jgi:hypothetical protein